MRDNFLETYLLAVIALLAIFLGGGLPIAARLHERGVGLVGVVTGGLLVGLLFLGAFFLIVSVIAGYACDLVLLKAAGWWWVALGVLIAVFSRIIVFPGLEWLLGIEKIVGSENVSYQPDGSYHYTNPGAMVRWIASVAGVGMFMTAFGIACILCARRKMRRTRA